MGNCTKPDTTLSALGDAMGMVSHSRPPKPEWKKQSR
jgi:hypothetical protein